MAVVAEVPALVLELDSNALPLPGPNLALRLAVRETRLHSLHVVPQFLGYHAEEKDDAVLVGRFMSQAAEVDGIAGTSDLRAAGCALALASSGRVRWEPAADAGEAVVLSGWGRRARTSAHAGLPSA